MPAISIDQLDALPDVLGAFRFEFLLGILPGGGFGQDLTLRCQQVVYPGSGHEPMQVGLAGHELIFRGRKLFQRQLGATFIETHDMAAMRPLKNWQEFIVGTKSGNGASKSQYALRSPVLNVYDERGVLADSVTIRNLVVQDIQDTQLDGQSSQIFMVNCVFSYDWIEYTFLAPPR